MRTFKVEGSGNLSDCCERGKSGTGVFPVDFESDALRICPDARVDALQQLNKFRDTLSVSGQSRRGSLVRPIIVAERTITSVSTRFACTIAGNDFNIPSVWLIIRRTPNFKASSPCSLLISGLLSLI